MINNLITPKLMTAQEFILSKYSGTCELPVSLPIDHVATLLDEYKKLPMDREDTRLWPSKKRLEFILEIVSEVTGVHQEDIKSKIRFIDRVTARQHFFYFAIYYTNIPLARIGSFCGSRDHTTVIHNRNIAKVYLKNEIGFRLISEEIKERVEEKLSFRKRK